ncbi:MAG: hypothetical protein Q9218_001488 [Villophora microphyllina]
MDGSLGGDSTGGSKYANEQTFSSDVFKSSPSVSANDSAKTRKRKRSSDDESGHRSIRQKAHYSAKYLRLLNQTVGDIHLDSLGSDVGDFYISQVGIAVWSSEEKELLFRGTARYGRDNLPAIARLVGSKSELEVRVYLQLLQEVSTKQHMYGKRPTLVGPAAIPTATEISQDCCAHLEQAADALSILQQKREERQEQQNHADLWRLDRNTARWVEKRIREGERGRAEVHEKLPAAELLNLDRFLKLSEQLFMNSNESDGNWRSYVSRKDKVSILYTAFSDLHNVTTGIVKRLIQSSLFCAMSRLRASHSHYDRQQAVKRCDVLAALRILGMKETARDQWLDVVRKHNLNVYDLDADNIMTYSQIEGELSQTKFAADVMSTSTSENQDMDPQAQPSDTDSPQSGYDPATSSQASILCRSDSDEGSPRHSRSTSNSTLQEALFDRETDTYLDYIDQKASRKEELHLWEMLGKDPPESFSRKDQRMVKDPGPYRHDQDDLDHWRGWVNLIPEWEAYDVKDLETDLLKNRRQPLPRPKSSVTLPGRRSTSPRGRRRTRRLETAQLESSKSSQTDARSHESVGSEEESENPSSVSGGNSGLDADHAVTDDNSRAVKARESSLEDEHQPSSHNGWTASQGSAKKEIPDTDEESRSDGDE